MAITPQLYVRTLGPLLIPFSRLTESQALAPCRCNRQCRGQQLTMTHIHIHWSRNPRLVKETRLGITICGLKGIPRAQLTAYADDATCPRCIKVIENEKFHTQNTNTLDSRNTGRK